MLKHYGITPRIDWRTPREVFCTVFQGRVSAAKSYFNLAAKSLDLLFEKIGPDSEIAEDLSSFDRPVNPSSASSGGRVGAARSRSVKSLFHFTALEVVPRAPLAWRTTSTICRSFSP
jgi:hypothetical protein